MDASLLSEFVEHRRLHLRNKEGSITRYRNYVTRFLRWTKKAPAEIDYKDINRYIGQLKADDKAINTQRLHLAAIRAFFAWYCKTEQRPNPCDNIYPIGEEIKIPRVLSPEELIRMVYLCDVSTFRGRRDAAFLCLLADTGIRKGEAELLKVGNIHPMEDHFVLHVPPIKRSFARAVPFCRMKETHFVSEFWLSYWMEITLTKRYTSHYPLFLTDGVSKSGTALKASGIYALVKRYAKKAELENVSPHSLRHFYGTYSYLNKTPLIELQKLMGHALLETTRKYIHIAGVISGEILDRTATANMQAPPWLRGYVKIWRDSFSNGKKPQTKR